jgi:uncharacterized Zn finger protein
MSYGDWPPYVPVAERRRKAKAQMQKLKKKGLDVQPIEIEGRKIAKSFWGIAWNDHLESFGDYANRIPRGRTYVRNGSVCHLDIQKGKVEACVSGSSIYRVNISIHALPSRKWTQVKSQCAGQVGSMLELLQGKLSSSVMSVVTDKKSGLFPAPGEINLNCDCPDDAYMCKHIAAVLYGVGARLDHQPEFLFKLRGVDHEELISADVALVNTTGKTKGSSRRIADDSLADVFGIDISQDEAPAPKKKTAKKKTAKKTVKKTAKKTTKKTAKKKTARKKAPRQRNAKGDLIFTSHDIVALRRKFDMREIEFSHLCGVSVLTIQNWENKSGVLRLRKNSREALEEIEKFTKKKARKELADITGF